MLIKTKIDNTYKGIISILLTGFCFSSYGVFSRYVAHDFAAFYQTGTRYAIGSIIFLILTILLHSWKPIMREDRKWFVLQGLFCAIVNIPFYLAVIHLPIGIALFLFYASSVIISFLFGSIFLNEKLNNMKLISLILSIIGIFLIYHGEAHNFQSLYVIMAVLAGIFYGLYSASSKKLNLKYSEIQINLVIYIITLLSATPFIFLLKEHIFLDFSAFSWKMNFLYSVVGVVTSFLLIYGFKFVEAQKGSLILLSELIFVVINGYLFFHEIPSIYAIIGGISILIALSLPNIPIIDGNN
jgi:drug/metabolite transporter (DMT)-like permease